MPERFRDRHLGAFERYVRTREPRLLGRPLRVPALRCDGQEVSIELLISTAGLPTGRLLVGLLRDVSDQVDIEGPGDLGEIIFGVVADAPTLQEARQRILAAIGESLNWDVAQLWEVDEDGELHRRCAWHREPATTAPFDAASDRTFLPGQGLPGSVWERRAAAWITEVSRDSAFPRAEAARASGLRGGFAFPLTAGGAVVAVVEVFSRQLRPPSQHVEGRLTELGRELGAFMTRRAAEEERLAWADLERQARAEAEQAQAQLAEFARTLQQSLLPPVLPDIEGLELAGRYHPAGTGTEVGGDFYDVFRMTRGVLGFAIGDVCGKGPEAAALTALVRYTLRAAAMQSRSPAKALLLLNGAMLRQASDDRSSSRFATVLHGRIRHTRHNTAVTIASGGHPLPLLVRDTGEVALVGVPGTLLGVLPRVSSTDVSVALAPGDALVSVTDGVLEARRAGKFLDQEGLISVLEAVAGAPAAEVASAVEAAALDFQGGEAADDIAVLVVKRPRH